MLKLDLKEWFNIVQMFYRYELFNDKGIYETCNPLLDVGIKIRCD